MKASKDRQKEFRTRRAAKFARMETALQKINMRLQGNDKPLAVEIRGIAIEALIVIDPPSERSLPPR